MVLYHLLILPFASSDHGQKAFSTLTQKTRQATSCMSNDNGRSTKDHLMDKHPEPQPLRAQALYKGPARSSLNHPVAFAGISADVIGKPSSEWVDLPVHLGSMSVAGRGFASHSAVPQTTYVCVAIALLCKRLCTEYVDPAEREALIACQLIALDKCAGLRPIGVGECLRRLIGRAIVQCTKMDIRTVCCWGPTALCVVHGWLRSCHPYTHRHLWDWWMWSHVIRGCIECL